MKVSNRLNNKKNKQRSERAQVHTKHSTNKTENIIKINEQNKIITGILECQKVYDPSS